MVSEQLPGGSEHVTQSAFVEWCVTQERRYPDLKMGFAIPNGGARHVAVAKRLKAEGVRPGVPDWCLPVPNGFYIGLWIEFKHGKNKATVAQDDFHFALRSKGHRVEICYTVDSAIAVVESYLNQK